MENFLKNLNIIVFIIGLKKRTIGLMEEALGVNGLKRGFLGVFRGLREIPPKRA